MTDARVEVKGLKELQRAFKQVDTQLPKQLRDAMKVIADHVVGVAQQKMPFRTGTAAKSVKPRATQRGAGIAYPSGGKPWQGDKTGYYPWLDFGGRVGRGKSVVRPFIKTGRFIYPSISESKEFIAVEVDKAIVETAHSAGFDVSGGAE